MKLSFSMQSKSNSKSNPIRPSNKFDAAAADAKDGNSKAKEYVTEFDASKSPSNSDKSAMVIPPIENEWNIGRYHKRMKHQDLPITESNGTEVGFELHTSTVAEPASDMSYGLNLRQIKKDDADGEKPTAGNGGGGDIERSWPIFLDSLVLQKFRDDMKRLPDDRGFDEFKDVAVEGFGAAVLAGYGWREGMGIGKNAKEDVKVVQYERRTAKEGLGFVGDHARKRSSKEEVKIPNDSRNKRRRDEGRRGSDEIVVDVKRDCRKEEHGKKQVSWLTSHIRVRVISKGFKRGRLYLKKGQVLDVLGPTTCDISMDDTDEIIHGVSQDFLETAIPRRGGPVLVLYGKHKGVYGSLDERDLDKEMAVVRDADTHALFNVQLDQIAEFIGDPSIVAYGFCCINSNVRPIFITLLIDSIIQSSIHSSEFAKGYLPHG